MADRSPLQDIELFHLLFLRALETKLDRSRYVVKGGVNVRAWFGSARYSEDLDLDVSGIGRDALAGRIDLVLAGPPLSLLLRAQDLTLSRTTKPKQTDTTQRWKVAIRSGSGGVDLPSKIECSRRDSPDEYVLEAARAEIVRPYGILPPTANHYTAGAAIRQKIRALARRRETQARDVWDLDHLFRTAHGDPRPLSDELRQDLAVAVDRVTTLPHEAYRAQVVAFLDPQQQELWGTREAWEHVQELVLEELLRLER